MTVTTRRVLATAAALAACATTLVPPAAQAATPAAAVTGCTVTWGSLPTTVNAVPERTGPVLPAPRFGHHACFDRAVFDVQGPVGTVSARYEVIAGGAVFLGVHTRHDTVNPPATPAILLGTTMPTIVGRSESEWTTRTQGYSLATRARLPYRVFVLKGPGSTNRIVVDVAHRW